jgi:GntR family transcriptional regulator
MQSGMLRPGDLVGTEKDIQQRYAVSRATVRKALDELGRAGQLVRITGRGTFVAEPALSLHLPHLLSLTEELRHRGVVPGGQILAFEPLAAPGDAAEALRCRAGETTLHIRRLRTGDDVPIVLVDHYLAAAIKLKREDLGQSLYSTPEEADMLAIQPGEAVLRFTRTTLNRQGLPVVYETGSGRGDLYDYSVHLFRQ